MLFFSETAYCLSALSKDSVDVSFFWLYRTLYAKNYVPFHKGNTKVMVHRYFREGHCDDAHIVDNQEEWRKEYAEYFKFSLTRDPIKRFVSMYSNRVLHHAELSETSPVGEKLRKQGLECTPTIDYLVEHLDDYMRTQGKIFHHARPQVDFLGPDPDIYDMLVDMRHTDRVLNEIKRFWRQAGMAVEQSKGLKRAQTGGPKLSLSCLSRSSFEKMLQFYVRDYDTFPTMSIESTTHQYERACSEGSGSNTEAYLAALAQQGSEGLMTRPKRLAQQGSEGLMTRPKRLAKRALGWLFGS